MAGQLILLPEEYSFNAEYHPEEKVWTSRVMPNEEWDSLLEMRRDVLIHLVCHEHELNKGIFEDLYDDEAVIEKLNELRK